MCRRRSFAPPQKERIMALQELREQRKRLADQAQEVLDKAATEKRELQGDEEKKFDDIHADIDKLRVQIEREEKQEAVLASLSEPQTKRSSHNTVTRNETRTLGKATREDADLALRAWLLSGADDAEVSESMQASAARCHVDLGRKRIKLRLSPNALRSLQTDDVREWEAKEEKRAAMGVSSGSIGLYTVPDAPMQAIEKALLAYGGMRTVATVLRTDSGADLPIPTNNDTSNTGRLLAENTQVTETDLTYGQLVLQSYKWSSDVVLAAVEFLQDSSLNVADFLGTALGTRIARSQNGYFTTGTGNSQPNGIVTAATSSSVTFAGSATVTYDNIIDLIHSVDPSYRENGRFMFHDGGLKMLKKVKIPNYSGDTGGTPLWQPSLVSGQPDLIHGYPYVINQSMATPTGSAKSILFGDLSKYIIRDSRDITLIRLDERYADYHQVGFLAFARSDGDLLDAGTHPVKYGTQA
jgi:HK97 family phage major capsid protein